MASSAGIFPANFPTRLRSILEEHYSRQMPFIMEGEGFMLFSSGQTKAVYDGLSESIKEGVRHHPAALKLHAPTPLCSEITINATIENSSEEPSAPVRPLINVSERGLSTYYLKDIYDIDRLKALQAELGYRSSPEANGLKSKVEGRLERLQWLADNLKDPVPVKGVEEFEIEQPVSRPFRSKDIQALEALYWQTCHDRETMTQLYEELQHRSSPTSIRLRDRVRGRLTAFQKDEPDALLYSSEHVDAKTSAVPAEVTEEERKVETKEPRPFSDKTAQQLQALYWQIYTNRELLEQLYAELQHRSVLKSIRLRDRVLGRLNVLKKAELQEIAHDSVGDDVQTMSESVVKEKRPAVRPYVGKTTAQLKILHLRSGSGVTVQQDILAELQFFTTPEAMSLRVLVEHKLDELQRDSEAVSSDDQVGLVESDEVSVNSLSGPADGNLDTVYLLDAQRRAEQKEKADAARLFTYKTRLLQGLEPSPPQLAVFNSLDEEAKADFLTKVELEKQLLTRRVSTGVINSEADPVAEPACKAMPSMADLLNKVDNALELARKAKSADQEEFAVSVVPIALEKPTHTRQSSLDESYIVSGFSEEYAQPIFQTLPAIELVADLTRPYARVQGILQKGLARQDFRILLMLGVQDRKLNEVGNDLSLNRRDVKRRLKELIAQIGEQHAEPLKAFAEPLDALLDEQDDEILLEHAAEKLGLTLGRMKFLVLVAGAHFRQPCKIHRGRVFRPTNLLD
nr:hypothetical protein [Endozoicomonas sp.]